MGVGRRQAITLAWQADHPPEPSQKVKARLDHADDDERRAAGSGTPGRRLAAFFMLGDMTIQRMDNVAIVVDDLDAAVAFFAELGMELEGKGQVEGLWADRTVGLDGVRSDIAMMRTPDGHSKLELTKYHTPAASGAEPENPPPNTLGLHRVMFAVDDIDDTIARLRAHGAELLGEVAQYESIFRLCYLRGPAGIIVALAEQIG
jgi:catechol 2,3-dioxygenase-like lactoylglutathione lyase family enzyme